MEPFTRCQRWVGEPFLLLTVVAPFFCYFGGPGAAKMLPKPFPRTFSTDTRCMMRALEIAQMPPKEYPGEGLAGLRTPHWVEDPAQGCSFVCVSNSLRIICDCGSFFGLAYILPIIILCIQHMYVYICFIQVADSNKKYLNLETNSNKVVRCIRGSMLQILRVF